MLYHKKSKEKPKSFLSSLIPNFSLSRAKKCEAPVQEKCINSIKAKKYKAPDK